MSKPVVILPCSGIGKAYGEIARQAAYKVVGDMNQEVVTTTCLGKVMIKDPDTMKLLDDSYVITVDGCAKDCARKNVESSGHQVNSAVRTLEVFKEHRDLKPQGVLNLGETGNKLAEFLAEKLNDRVECLAKEGQ